MPGRAKKRCIHRGCDQQQPCPIHKRREVRSRQNVQARSKRYGPEHRKTREDWAPIVATGTVPCRRADYDLCLEDDPLIAGDAKWHLGHPDDECPAPTSPEHVRCNSATRNRPEREQV